MLLFSTIKIAFKCKKVTMAKYNITPPDLNDCKSFEAYKCKLSAWAAVTDLASNKHGNYIVLSLPNKSRFGSDIRERVLESLSEE